MRVVVTSLLGLGLGLFLSGIGAASAQTEGRAASSVVPLGAQPAAVTRFCLDRARRHKFPVLCPTRYPRTSQSEVTPSGSSLLGSSFYWASFNDAAGFGTGDNGHLVFGGQRPLFSLSGLPSQTWPRPGEAHPVKQLNLPRLLMSPMQDGRQYVAQRPARILRRASVHARPALILVADPYPLGGFMGRRRLARAMANSPRHATDALITRTRTTKKTRSVSTAGPCLLSRCRANQARVGLERGASRQRARLRQLRRPDRSWRCGLERQTRDRQVRARRHS